jgi:hypothetical protein
MTILQIFPSAKKKKKTAVSEVLQDVTSNICLLQWRHIMMTSRTGRLSTGPVTGKWERSEEVIGFYINCILNKQEGGRDICNLLKQQKQKER